MIIPEGDGILGESYPTHWRPFLALIASLEDPHLSSLAKPSILRIPCLFLMSNNWACNILLCLWDSSNSDLICIFCSFSRFSLSLSLSAQLIFASERPYRSLLATLLLGTSPSLQSYLVFSEP